jgi:hypothetical protein
MISGIVVPTGEDIAQRIRGAVREACGNVTFIETRTEHFMRGFGNQAFRDQDSEGFLNTDVGISFWVCRTITIHQHLDWQQNVLRITAGGIEHVLRLALGPPSLYSATEAWIRVLEEPLEGAIRYVCSIWGIARR